MASDRPSINRLLSFLIGFLVVSAIYLYAFPQANVLYAAIVLLHAVAGVVASIWFLVWLVRSWRRGEPLVRAGISFLFFGAIPGIVLIYTGALRTHWTLLYVHIGVSFLAAGLLIAAGLGNRGWGSRSAVVRIAVALALMAALVPVARYLREGRWAEHARIENPKLPPLTMDGEGDEIGRAHV